MKVDFMAVIEKKMFQLLDEWTGEPSLAPEKMQKLMNLKNRLEKKREELEEQYMSVLDYYFNEAQKESVKRLQSVDNFN